MQSGATKNATRSNKGKKKSLKTLRSAIENSPSEIAFCISAHFWTTLWSLRPSSSSIRYSAVPFLLELESECRSGESLTRETRIHWTTEKTIPTMAQAGTKISVPRSDRIAMDGRTDRQNPAPENQYHENTRENNGVAFGSGSLTLLHHDAWHSAALQWFIYMQA